MEKKANRILLILALAVTLTGAPPAASIASGQQKGTKQDGYPTFFKVYSKDGGENLTAECEPIDLSTIVNRVTCKFVQVRFDSPQKKTDKLNEADLVIPLSLEDLRKKALADPTLAEEAKKSPRKFEDDIKEGFKKMVQEMHKNKQNFCRDGGIIETKLRDPEIGTKRKGLFQQLLAACSEKDALLFAKRLMEVTLDLDRRTCGLYVDHFTLEFKKVKEGQWLYRQDEPGLLSKVLKVYELTETGVGGIFWTLTETRVPAKGAKEKPTQSVWSWENSKDYELPCEFVSYTVVPL